MPAFFLPRKRNPKVKTNSNIDLADVQKVYSGPEGDLWELVMGEQIHIGGFASSMDLADKAEIQPGSKGIDLCCCNGAGMRFLVRFRDVAQMHGVDVTEKVVTSGRTRCEEEALDDRITFTVADACETGLETASADFLWAEDAWCYVLDKDKLIAEAARLTKPAGTIAFTDWVEGPAGLSDLEAERFLAFMKFPNIQDIPGYRTLLEANNCSVTVAHDTGRFAPCADLYIDMLLKQLTYDALKTIGFNADLMQTMGKEMDFMRQLAHDGKIAQGLFVARKK